MSKTIGLRFGLIGGLMASSLIDYNTRTTARLEANDFEKRLGSFDTSAYFLRNFSERINESQVISIDLVKDTETADRILGVVREKGTPPKSVVNPATGKKYEKVAAFRMAYGLAMRVGPEQFGFAKTYRPFIRLNGVVTDVSTGQVTWRDSVLVFGEKGYKGDDADADRIDPAELIAAFEKLTPQVIDLTLLSLNAKPLPPMPWLNDTSAEDFEY